MHAGAKLNMRLQSNKIYMAWCSLKSIGQLGGRYFWKSSYHTSTNHQHLVCPNKIERETTKSCSSLGDVISMEEGSLGARSIKGARTLVNLDISRDLPPPITEGPGMGGPGHSLV
ncbi:Uncharacterized protein Fot_22455 [Forsythia ovata]|uniref:Uncharacterized protein n=1 Tax=Forsythia ovata TaxID=205694 RepID=A0ABD1UXS2_9LAMI